jgi:hypothetical protein
MKRKGTTLIHRPKGDSKKLIMCLMISEAAYLANLYYAQNPLNRIASVSDT